MTRSSRIALAAVTALAAAGDARSQNQPLPSALARQRVALWPDSLMLSDVRVVQVITGGSWIDGDRRGHFRVIVLRDGDDVTHHTTYVQWMERQGLTENVEIVRTIDLQSRATSWFQLLSPELKWSRGIWLVSVEAADAPMRPSKKRITFVLGTPGVARLR